LTLSLRWTKFQDFYLRLGFLKALVAALGSERRSVPAETILRRLRKPLFDFAVEHPDLAGRVDGRMDWYGKDWWKAQSDKGKMPTVAEAMIVDADLPSFLYAITAPTTYKIVDWGRNVGLLGRGNQITERGLTLLAMSAPRDVQQFLEGNVDAWNPFILSTVERLFFLYHLIEIDRTTLLLADAIGQLGADCDIETFDAAKLLAQAMSEVLADAGVSIRPPEIPAYRTALELAATICDELGLPPPSDFVDSRRRAPRPMKPAVRRKALIAGSGTAAVRRTHKNADHQTIPRFEQLVDLGFLSKGDAPEDLAARRRWKWRPTPVATRWAAARNSSRETGSTPFLWDGFARVACHAYAGVDEPGRPNETAILAAYLAKGYRLVRRAVGHTPFDSVALMAMALGVVDGIAIEMVDFHRMMLTIKTQGLLQGEVFFASGNDLDKMFVSVRDDFAERAMAALPTLLPSERPVAHGKEGMQP
jgi:hypothetical protein